MILKNVDAVLAAIKEILNQITDDMFDMDGEILEVEESYAPRGWEELYPIKNGIEFMRKNYPDIPIHISIIEITKLSNANINPEIGG